MMFLPWKTTYKATVFCQFNQPWSKERLMARYSALSRSTDWVMMERNGFIVSLSILDDLLVCIFSLRIRCLVYCLFHLRYLACSPVVSASPFPSCPLACCCLPTCSSTAPSVRSSGSCQGKVLQACWHKSQTFFSLELHEQWIDKTIQNNALKPKTKMFPLYV